MTIDVLAAFGAGLLTFTSPCILPLMPAYLSVLAGGSTANLRSSQRVVGSVLPALAFALGLGVVFVLLGLAASSLGRLISGHRTLLQQVGGLVVFTFGLKQLGVLKLPWLERDARPLLLRVGGSGGIAGSFAFGAAFGLGWTPCIGPVLGSVLTYTASSGASAASGVLYLSAYAAGLALPLVVGAAMAPLALRWQQVLMRHLRRIEVVTGLLLAVMGLLLVTDKLGVLIPDPATGSASFSPASPPSEVGKRPVLEGATCGTGDSKLCTPDVLANDEPSLSPLPERLGSLGGSTQNDPIGTRGPVLIEFVSKHCPICERMAPVLAAAEAACPKLGVRIEKVEVDTDPGRQQARQARVQGVPTFLLLDSNGREVARLVGEQRVASLTQSLEILSGRRCPGFSRLQG